MKIKRLSKSQKEIYDYILYFAKKHDALPTTIEIADGTGFNRNTIRSALLRFEEFGLVKVRKIGHASSYSVNKLKYVEVEN